ncbi:guanine deaminase [Ketogulonicigenium robustum]|uniref:Guanine deaminase n=1 Tax=Ketogulonicigenium robustum TaxID=92947 RepID=A0A1W6P2Z2_9RHOB|nr:amidohydrolase family protein [Ketogulonicigenium robustum]ARO15799.1 guanine deaminase [Ketogulonicigenium robustum]
MRLHHIKANAFHAPTLAAVEELPDTLITCDDQGTIVAVTPGGDHADALRLPAGQVLLPGFVDLHVHAPQYPQLGSALDLPLEDWLQHYTFPLEARYADLDFARDVYSALIDDMLALGTTAALHFATVHVPATNLLADICLAKGQRAVIGKVAMDDPAACPDYYRDASAADAVAGTRAVIDHIHTIAGVGGLVAPAITPRFIPSCTDECLHGLGQLAAETGVRVQSHISESDWAHGYVQDRMGQSDAESLAHFGLLRPHSVFAHGTHLSESDMALLRDHGAGVAHCAASNAYFAGAVFPLRRALDMGLNTGLGTDISGGPSPSIFEAARMTVAASRIRQRGVDAAAPSDQRGTGEAPIDMATAFHLATRGGAQTLGLPTGSFAVGMKFDAMAVDTTAAAGTIRPFGATGLRLLEKILHTASRPNIAAVWTDGVRRV